ncbi:hemin uptake protein HemP [Limnoglobus roseus]|uniref:Hemin uptake protein HemP n=1 Tax=Limnoglobus roseus TaxID=2598579 RepID=A0A5C1ATX5_9BACT|nr:hemin uptake protein HemP [Limnoglobus roseus]QEL21052.1 hemin uptake protein HemP [Limnoglobus roseus]
MSEPEKLEKKSTEAAHHEAAPVVQAKELFGECREIVIEHDGERYKLRITRRGKLILQK